MSDLVYLTTLLRAKSEGIQIVIPDIKCYSPKEGDLMRGRNPVEYAKLLVAAGAPVLSVVTEEKEFHGSLQMLRDIADAVSVPILRKDFIHTREDLIATKEAGASAILLMCSCLEKEELKMLYHAALEIGLTPFVETHVEEDFELVNELDAKFVGINNRDILVLERDNGDVSNTCRLIGNAPKDAFIVTESSIENPEQVRSALRAGADAALVGTAILQAENTQAFYKMMCMPISLKICGLMNEHDIKMCVDAGVERIGLVTEFPLDVPWNLSVDEAARLRTYIPQGYQACMVTGGDFDTIMERAKKVRPNLVQLHYNETLEDTIKLTAALRELGIGVIKTIPVSDEARLAQFGTTDIEDIIKMLCATDIEAILLDPRHGKDIAKKNLEADVELMVEAKRHSAKPIILAGGLNDTNLEGILELTDAEAVDIMNGSEDAPGKKNKTRIDNIVQAISEMYAIDTRFYHEN